MLVCLSGVEDLGHLPFCSFFLVGELESGVDMQAFRRIC